jgi:ankyrin repeat protein
LVAAGIDINKAGDLGYTPLHVACMKGNIEMVKFLVEKGADLFALSEGNPPFTCARLAGHDRLCAWLGPLMKHASSQDQRLWLKARRAQLLRELAHVDARLAGIKS